MTNNEYISTTELAKLLGISRVAVFQKIKNGEIPAKKAGRNYVIAKNNLPQLFGHDLSEREKEDIRSAVKKTIEEYGETLRLLGKE